jgi:hypothetical protein
MHSKIPPCWKKDQWSEKGGNWKNGGYDKKAPTGGVYQIECQVLLK